MISKLCILSSYYPSETDPHYAFVGTLVEQFADMGIECHVISPVSNREKKHRAVSRTEITKSGAKIKVYCPEYTLFPSRVIAGFHTYKLTVHSLWRAILKTYKEEIGSCDAIYSHFIESGVNAAWLKKKVRVPAFMAVGESNLRSKELTYSLFGELLYNELNGVISVSSPLRQQLLDYNVVSLKTPIMIAPNGIDTDVFSYRDRRTCRDKLKLDYDTFVVSFVGGFIKRKGFDIVQEVIQRHPNWKCILIGSGEIQVSLNNDQIAYVGRVSHNEIPDYICSSDVFLLPTQAEGCCNAIIEAMGCGLPIVSSDKDFNYDILDTSFAKMVNPDSIEEIEKALIELYDNPSMRKQYAINSFNAGKRLAIDKRAIKIVEFMESNQ